MCLLCVLYMSFVELIWTLMKILFKDTITGYSEDILRGAIKVFDRSFLDVFRLFFGTYIDISEDTF